VIDLLYNISLQVPDLLMMVGCALLFGAGGVLLARLAHWLWWTRKAGDRDPARDAGDGVHSSILALIAFLMALITTNELASFGNANRQITQEALSITRLDRELASIGHEGAQRQKLLLSYVDSVAQDEWPRLAQRPQSLSPVSGRHLEAH
jgi:H+/Cl- antiporter ClcA